MLTNSQQPLCDNQFSTSIWYHKSTVVISKHRVVTRESHRNSVRLSVTRVEHSKAVQARITKSSPSAAWKTLVSGTVKLFHKFEGGHSEQGR